jgi:hypothetical protein
VKSVSHIYEVRPRKDRHGFDLIFDVLPFDRLWYDTPDNAIDYAMHHSRSHNAVIRVTLPPATLMDRHRHKGNPPKRSSGKKERPPMRRPLRVLLNALPGQGLSA